MLEKTQKIVSLIVALNLCALIWHISLQDVSIENLVDSNVMCYNGNIDIHINEQSPSYNTGSLLCNKRHLIKKSQRAQLVFWQEMTTVSITNEIDDDHKLIDLTNFEYKIKQPECGQHIRALIVVHSAPSNFKKRQVIRQTWGEKNLLQQTPVRVLFFFGMVLSKKLEKNLIYENWKYNDMVQGNFQDSYRNITYKHVMALKWYIQECRHAEFLIKVDDDVFINTPLLLTYMRAGKFSQLQAEAISIDKSESKNTTAEFFNGPRQLLVCDRNNKASPKRTYRSKWRVSYQEYAHEYYPPYCPGYAIIYSTDVVERLYKTAQKHKFFWIDDVFITGILAQINGIDITPISSSILTEEKRKDLLNNKVKLEELEFLFTTHNINCEEIRELWKLIKMNKSTISVE